MRSRAPTAPATQMMSRVALLIAAAVLLMDRYVPSSSCFAYYLLPPPVAHRRRSRIPTSHSSRSTTTTTTATTRLALQSEHHDDLVEMMIGGGRFDGMVQLPDSMLATTLYVGNLCEFVHDDDLSDLFQTVSVLQSLPAVVVRKPTMESLRYGFVSFPTVEEKEAAVIRFHHSEFRGRRIKVEPIRDDRKFGRVRVPERIVEYVSGIKKKTRTGKANTLRRITGGGGDDDRGSSSSSSRNQKASKKSKKKYNKKNRGGRDEQQIRLTDQQQGELDRAKRRGYLTLVSKGNHGRKHKSSLFRVHRQCCDTQEKPQIVLIKGSVDQLTIDLSPLRLAGLFDADPDAFLVKWKAQILTAASNANMGLKRTSAGVGEYNDDGDVDTSMEGGSFLDSGLTLDETTRNQWATKPTIDTVPVLSMGTFVGERSCAKQMARELAGVWGLPCTTQDHDSGRYKNLSPGRRRKPKQRGGGHRQKAW